MSEYYGRQITFTVYGDPVAKRDGGSQAVLIRGPIPRAFVHKFTPAKVRDWQNRVMDAAIAATEGMKRPLFPKGAVNLDLIFRFPKPKAAKKYQDSKFTKPDADRLQCAIQDALQGIIYTTDAQVAKWSGAKFWVQGPASVHIVAKEIIAQKDSNT